MEQADPKRQDPEAFDAAVAIWGDAPPSKAAASPDTAPTDIWGHAAPQAAPADEADPVVRWPDVWGDQEGWRSPPEGVERRHGPLPGGTDRFARPEWWAVPPKPRSQWRQRLHRK
jgi:hypothetical protein